MEPWPLAAHDVTEPRELTRWNERERLVRRLEDRAAFVELVAPAGLVAGDARVQNEVVVVSGDRNRVELDRPEPPEDIESTLETGKRPRRREKVPRDEKPARRLNSHLHPDDPSPSYGAATTRRGSGHIRTLARATVPTAWNIDPVGELR